MHDMIGEMLQNDEGKIKHYLKNHIDFNVYLNEHNREVKKYDMFLLLLLFVILLFDSHNLQISFQISSSSSSFACFLSSCCIKL